MMADDRPAKRIAPRLVAVAAALCGTLRAAESVAVAAPPAATAAKHQGAASGPIRQSSHAAPVSATSDLVERAAENRSSAPPSPQAARGALAAGEVKTRLQADESSANRPRDGLPRGASHLSTMLVSLAVVLGLFFLVAWTLRRSLPRTAQRLPREVVEVLGQAALAHRQQAQLVRLGNKLLLVSVSSSGAETLAEVTDPVEVARLAALCRGPSGAAAAANFRDVFQQLRGRSSAPSSAKDQPSAALSGRGRQEDRDA